MCAKRQRQQVDVLGHQQLHARQRLELGDHVPVGQLHALGLAHRPRSVDDRGQLVRLERAAPPRHQLGVLSQRAAPAHRELLEPQDLLARAQRLDPLELVQAHPHPGARQRVLVKAHRDLEPPLRLPHPLQTLLELVRVLDQRDARARVLQDRLAALGHRGRVDRDDDGPSHQDGHVEPDPLDARGADQRHAIAGLDPARDEPGGEPLGSFPPRAPGALRPLPIDAMAKRRGRARQVDPVLKELDQRCVCHRAPLLDA